MTHGSHHKETRQVPHVALARRHVLEGAGILVPLTPHQSIAFKDPTSIKDPTSDPTFPIPDLSLPSQTSG